MRLGLAVVCLLVVTAGCVDAVEDGGDDPVGDSAMSVDNPWGSETVTVGITNLANESRDLSPMVSEALTYWAESEHGTYNVSFDLRPDRSDVDLMVVFQERVECNQAVTAGCAPLLDSRDSVQERPLRVQIEAGYTDTSTVTVLKHEFGHVLGLTHSDKPQEFMTASLSLMKFKEPNFAERRNPWMTEDIGVYVDWQNHQGDRAPTERQFERAFGYYEEASTTPQVSFERVSEPSQARVIVQFNTGDCEVTPGSCRRHDGTDTDGHGDINVLNTTTITLEGIDQERVGWHVGRWIGMAFAGGESDDIPEIFQDRERWVTEGGG